MLVSCECFSKMQTLALTTLQNGLFLLFSHLQFCKMGRFVTCLKKYFLSDWDLLQLFFCANLRFILLSSFFFWLIYNCMCKIDGESKNVGIMIYFIVYIRFYKCNGIHVATSFTNFK